MKTEQQRTGLETPPRAIELFQKLKNADHRQVESQKHRKGSEDWGFRVRSLKVKGTNGVIIKRLHEQTALETIQKLQNIVQLHNNLYAKQNLPYVLKAPIGHPISKEFIAMSNTNLPAITEILEHPIFRGGTPRGQAMLEKLAKENDISKEELAKKLDFAMNTLQENTTHIGVMFPRFYGFKPRNILLQNYKKGKFVFISLMDLY